MIEIILPTLNEEGGLPLVAGSLKKQGFDDIIVIDGHSTDRTLEIAREIGAKIIMQEGRGKGMAFQTFLKRYPIKDDDFYIMLDSDNSYDPKDVNKFIEALKGCDIVTGHRTTVRYNVNDLTHYIGNKIISFTGMLFFLKWNPDICTGYWGFRGSSLKRIKIKARGFDLESNLFCQIAKKRLRHRIIKIDYYPRVGLRKLKASDALVIIRRIITERFSGD
jgi:glycosyltransferase involved in cell wall biosynthesis